MAAFGGLATDATTVTRIYSGPYVTGSATYIDSGYYNHIDDYVTGHTAASTRSSLTRKQRRKLYPVWPWWAPRREAGQRPRPKPRSQRRPRASGQASAWRCKLAPWGA